MTNDSRQDRVATVLRDAPLDDEPETEPERLAVERAYRSIERNDGKGIPHEEAMRRLTLD